MQHAQLVKAPQVTTCRRSIQSIRAIDAHGAWAPATGNVGRGQMHIQARSTRRPVPRAGGTAWGSNWGS